jgi:hypothetical protein
MQALRHARFLARLVLAWFALSLGVAIASPLIKPLNFDVVCASTGTGAMKLVTTDGSGDAPQRALFDCPLCSGSALPPSTSQIHAVFALPLGHVLRPIVAARIAALVLAPLPARGPPAFLVS